MKLRIHGDIETTYGMGANVDTYPPFSFPNHECVTFTNEDGEEYPKYVVFDFEVNVKDAQEAKVLKNFIEAFQGSCDGSFEVEIIKNREPKIGDKVSLYGGRIAEIIGLSNDSNNNTIVELSFPKDSNVKPFDNEKMYAFEIERYLD